MADGAERTRRARRAAAHGEERGEGERVVRHEEERQDGDDLLEPAGNDEDGRKEAAEEQRDVGRPPLIHLGGAAPEEAVAAHGE